MQLHADSADTGFTVRRVQPDAIEVNGRRLECSFLLHSAGVVEDWAVADATALRPSDLDAVLALEPSVVLLGTGQRQHFPAPAVFAACLTRGIGLEAMDNAAAARTYNVLVAEGRRVVAAFILPRHRPADSR